MAKLVISTLVQNNKYSTSVKTAEHSLYADEPLEVGGNNLGPTPTELMLAGLGSCTVMTLKMYYDRKNIPWQQIDVHTALEVKKADEITLSDDETHLIDKGRVRIIYKTIYIKSEMDDESFERAEYIASRCPVYLMMQNSVKSITRLERVK